MNNAANAPAPSTDSWSTPSPHWGTGIDPRSSENGLFTLFYGTLARCSQYDWLNAGRTLIDKTYLTILSKSCQLSMLGIEPTELASRLDAFIRTTLIPLWDELDELDHEERHLKAVAMVQEMNEMLFAGHKDGEEMSSHILYYLCPQLPVFPLDSNALQVLAQRSQNAIEGYDNFHQVCRSEFAQLLPQLDHTKPTAEYGDDKARALVQRRLSHGDWWQRRSLMQSIAL